MSGPYQIDQERHAAFLYAQYCKDIKNEEYSEALKHWYEIRENDHSDNCNGDILMCEACMRKNFLDLNKKLSDICSQYEP